MITKARRKVRKTVKRTFKSLKVRNFRLFYTGQFISLSGTWMQAVAQSWLVLQLTGSGTAVGVAVAAQFTPMLIGGPWGGVVADRVDKRRALIGLQIGSAGLAGLLGVLTSAGLASVWVVYVLAFFFGTIQALEVPTRQSFILEMVGQDQVSNAVSLNSVLMNISRVAGPAVAGVLIATVGIAACFYANAISYVAVVVALYLMRPEELERVEPVRREKGQLSEGFKYVWHTPAIRTTLVMMAAIGTLVFNFQTVLPVLAKMTFAGDAGTFAAFMASMGAGAVIGGLVAANREHPTFRALIVAAIALGTLVSLSALSPTVPVAIAAFFLVGVAGTSFIAVGNATLQVSSRPEMRGRVMALFAVAFLGSTPVGGPIVGYLSERFGARIALVVGGLAAIAGGIYGWVASRGFARDEIKAQFSVDGEVDFDPESPKPSRDGGALAVET